MSFAKDVLKEQGDSQVGDPLRLLSDLDHEERGHLLPAWCSAGSRRSKGPSRSPRTMRCRESTGDPSRKLRDAPMAAALHPLPAWPPMRPRGRQLLRRGLVALYLAFCIVKTAIQFYTAIFGWFLRLGMRPGDRKSCAILIDRSIYII